MNELELIQALCRDLPQNGLVKTGPGDDCAVLHFGSDQDFLFKTDAIVEGIHFTREAAPEKVGRKALARCLSDLAAMGGEPSAAVVTLGLPPGFDPGYVQSLYTGLKSLAQQHGVAIVGGETTTNPGQVLISIAMIGVVPRGKAILRSGAQAGQAIFVSGELGGSLAGKHLDFEPRVEQGRWLRDQFAISAMIDISDGLAADLKHILEASGVGAELLTTSIPISREAKLLGRAESARKTPLLAALTDGEDFELLFTVRSADAVPVLDGWKTKFPQVKLTCIGKITAARGLKLRDQEGVRDFSGISGYVHFSEGAAGSAN